MLAPASLPIARGRSYVGDGAVRYSDVIEAAGGSPARRQRAHLPRARFHALLARDFGLPERVQPMYLRVPDVDQPTHVNIEIRRLTLADLAAIERIERRAYPTPWSRSMFAGELAKTSSICLGAFDADVGDTLVAYLIISRYADAWHVMNVAVHDDYRGQGVATSCSTGCSS